MRALTRLALAAVGSALLLLPTSIGASAETPVDRGRYMAAIAAYRKSLKPVRSKVGEAQYKVPLPPSYGAPVGPVAEPNLADKAAYGAYLSGPVGHCVLCHTPPGGGKPFDMNLAYFGGRELPDFGHPGGVTI